MLSMLDGRLCDFVERENRIPIARCQFCDQPIYGADATHYADEAYNDGSVWFCVNCIDDYIRPFRISPETT